MAQRAVRTVNVKLSDTGMLPSEILVPADFPIQFEVTNVGSTTHQLKIPDQDYSVDVLPGQTCDVVWTFVNVGRFEMVSCYDDDVLHGLKGVLIVEGVI